jgi:phage repressor protein C with HTH and peptisase S24 domain
MNSLQDRISEAMEKSGVGQAELARRLRIKQPSVHALLNGSSQRTKYILDIAQALGVRPEWLQDGVGDMHINEAPPHSQHSKLNVLQQITIISAPENISSDMVARTVAAQFDTSPSGLNLTAAPLGASDLRAFYADLPDGSKIKVNIVTEKQIHHGAVNNTSEKSHNISRYAEVPRYETALSAGHGSITDQSSESIGNYIIDRQWLRTLTSSSPENLAVVKVSGDSMEPTLRNGDWVLVDRNQTEINREGIFAFAVGDAVWVKRLTLNLQDKLIRIISDNTKYPIQDLNEDELNIIGRIIWLAGREL